MLHDLLALMHHVCVCPEYLTCCWEASVTACEWLPCRVAALNSCTAGAAPSQPGLVSSGRRAQSAGVPHYG